MPDTYGCWMNSLNCWLPDGLWDYTSKVTHCFFNQSKDGETTVWIKLYTVDIRPRSDTLKSKISSIQPWGGVVERVLQFRLLFLATILTRLCTWRYLYKQYLEISNVLTICSNDIKLLPWKTSLTYLSPFLSHTWNTWPIKDGGNNALEVMGWNESDCFCLQCEAHIFKELVTNGLLGRYFLLSGSGTQSIENGDTDPFLPKQVYSPDSNALPNR